ncbi:MAG TPA: hypothetical protein VFO98_01620 [Marmoricola sp.]|nr:hypothetical protein [Marmoricola sp.]
MPGFRVLFLCVGNVCRSPLGERLLQGLLPAADFEVASAGVRALAGQPMSPRAAVELQRYGGDPAGFLARQLEPQLLKSSDLNLVATAELRSQVLAEWPAAMRRTFTVREFAALVDLVLPTVPEGEALDPRSLVDRAQARRSEVQGIDYDIPDPFRQSDAAHELAARLMHDAVDRIARGLLAATQRA